MKQYVTESDAVAMIKATRGAIFGCTFNKRTDGSERTGSWRIESGQGMRYDPEAKRLLPVRDMRKGFRMIPWEGIISFTIAGRRYVVIRENLNK
jgi:hypothetical protein